MSCNAPLRGYQAAPGAPLSFSEGGARGRYVEVPCGRCTGCRLDRSVQWAVRCVHEAQLHEQNCFITLTYDEEHLPPDLSLCRRDWQLFMKRLLKRTGKSVRFFMCGEYGELGSRPHYHACLFGLDFEDKVPWKKSQSGEQVFRSSLLESVWSLGHSSCGAVTFASAAYVARYVMKKEYGKDAGKRRSILDVTTGEIIFRSHEFCQGSLKPGVGRGWLDRFASDVFPRGQVVMNGREVKCPRYYDKWFSQVDPAAFERLQLERQRGADLRFDDNGPKRLRAKEQVLEARVSFLKREI